MFISAPTRSHVNPMIGVAQLLKKAGHHVVWLCLPRPDVVADQLAASGIEAIALEGEAPPSQKRRSQELAKVVRDPVAYPARVRQVQVDTVEAYLGPTRQRIREVKPDVIVLDGQVYPAVIASHLENVPYVSLATTLLPAEPPGFVSEFGKIIEGLAQDRAALFARHGVDVTFASVECMSPYLNLLFTTDALLCGAPLPPHTEAVGPSIPMEHRGDEVEFPWDRLKSDRPIVYASFGSLISWQPELYSIIAQAAESLGVQLVLSGGDLAATDFAHQLPGDALIVPYVPQLALLERCSAFITHGGANSIMEAMYWGVPLLVIPICRDQPLAGYFIEKASAGLVIDPDKITVENCREALTKLLAADSPQRAGVAKVRASYRAHDGARIAAERTQSLLARDKPAITSS